jgi:hypothetical protein
MGFVAGNVLLMDMETVNGDLLSIDDLKKLRDAGIETAYKFRTPWDSIEVEKGVYDWRECDAYLERVLAAGMRAVMTVYSTGPTGSWIPDSWFVKTKAGVQRSVLSPWNPDAMAYSVDFTRRFAERYTIPDKAMVACCYMTAGETIGLNEPMFYDDTAQASFHALHGPNWYPTPNEPRTEAWTKEAYFNQMVGFQNAILSVPGNCGEVWTQLHMEIQYFSGLYGNGSKWLPDLLGAYRALPGWTKTNQIYFTWIQWDQLWGQMQGLALGNGCDVYGGAEFATGIVNTVDKAIANGLRGQIVAPCYPEASVGGYTFVHDWMVANIKEADTKWRATGR